MYKKIFVFFLIALFMAGVQYAGAANVHNYPDYSNSINIDGSGEITEPPMYIKKVRYSGCGISFVGLASGDALLWDTSSADGVSVTAAYRYGGAGAIDGDFRFAGIAVTALATQDSGSLDNDDNWGYMCVQGYCLASIDESVTIGATTARLAPSAAGGLGNDANYPQSADVATLLESATAGGLYAVWIR